MTARRVLAAVTALAVLVAACSDDDAADPATDTPVSSDSVTSTDAPTTTRATTTTTTAPPPTTSPEEALRAQIAADYLASVDRYFELVNQPSLDNLAERAKLAAADGSEYYAAVVDKVESLVGRGDRIVPNEPDIRTVNIEAVELLGAAPYAEAMVTVCGVSNAREITPAENSPNGQEIDAYLGTGTLTAIRSREHVRLTEQGWLPTTATQVAEGIWEGEETCPPA